MFLIPKKNGRNLKQPFFLQELADSAKFVHLKLIYYALVDKQVFEQG